MGIGDRLLAKTANVGNKPSEPNATRPTNTEPRTSPGRLMDAQHRINTAQARIKELETQLEHRAALEVPLDALVEVSGRRRKLAVEQFHELKSNLAQHALATPILVRSLSEGRFEIVAGHNRVAAYRELGRKTIRANVATIDEGEIEFAAFFSNLLSPSLTDFEKYWNFKRLQELSGLSRTEIADSAGLSKSHVTRIFSFDALPEEAKAALAEKPERLGSNAAQKLAALTEAGKDKKVTEAIRRLVEDDGFTQDKAVALATEKPKATVPSATVVRSGRRKICEISTRNGVVGIRFFEKDASDAEVWSQRIVNFINKTLNEAKED
ncbi:Chromosome (plasmid) partitioning protein ParB [Candidatus Burkholderia pumila]|uniref:Chromosome (Plasmid) partitioning protein ParB n=1 Tax=Candidatus Burkholderia pumila TaxID=1090375 RepID=A0ABR5HLR7_9BURK|nr:Chromosome (plasmid) partitioning protein ParB [Candidatus Burkholderia pumila]